MPEGALDPLGLLVDLPGGLHSSEKATLPFQLLRVDDSQLALLWRFMQESRVGRASFLVGTIFQ